MSNRRRLRRDVRHAQTAQQARAEEYARGYATELSGFYGSPAVPPADVVETRLTLAAADREAAALAQYEREQAREYAEKVHEIDTIQRRFEAFHEANPWVLATLEKLIADDVAAGQQRGAIGMYWEVLRWRYNQQTHDPASTFKADNNYRSRYARLIVDRHPEWSEFLALRSLKAA